MTEKDLKQAQIAFSKQRRKAQECSHAIVHCYPLNEPHDISGEEVCWCEPDVEDFTEQGGGVLLVHHVQVWQ
jgi:hypothetical protein